MGRKPKGDQAKETLSIRISPELRKLLDLKADAEGRGITDIIEEGARLRLAMPDGFYDELSKAAWEFQIPVSTIIVNGILKKVAFEAAWLKVFGQSAPSAVAEFRFSEKGLVRGDELFQQLLGEYQALLSEAKGKLEESIRERKPVTLKPSEMENMLRGFLGLDSTRPFFLGGKIIMQRRELLASAYHEAGHVVMEWLYNEFDNREINRENAKKEHCIKEDKIFIQKQENWDNLTEEGKIELIKIFYENIITDVYIYLAGPIAENLFRETPMRGFKDAENKMINAGIIPIKASEIINSSINKIIRILKNNWIAIEELSENLAQSSKLYPEEVSQILTNKNLPQKDPIKLSNEEIKEYWGL